MSDKTLTVYFGGILRVNLNDLDLTEEEKEELQNKNYLDISFSNLLLNSFECNLETLDFELD